MDGAGNVYMADSANHTIRKVTQSGVVTTLAGSPGVSGSTDGTGNAARFYYPDGVAVDASGNVYVADTYNHTIRKVTPAGVVTTIGGDIIGSNDGIGSAACFYQPSGIAVDSAGFLYVADGSNRRISKGSLMPLPTISTVSPLPTGTSKQAYSQILTATGGAPSYSWAIAAGNLPAGLTLNSSGVISGTATVAGTANFIAQVTGSDTLFSTKAFTLTVVECSYFWTNFAGQPSSSGSFNGTGTAARFYGSSGVAVDGSGTVYVADEKNHTIRKVTTGGIVSTLAGSPLVSGTSNGVGSTARFNRPTSVAVDGSGTVYVADSSNFTIRKMTPAGMVTTIGGNARTGGSRDGLDSVARFYYPEGIAVDSSGLLYVADAENHRISKGIPISQPAITAVSPLPTGTQSFAYTTTLTATGGMAPYTWSVTAGGLPAGLVLSSSGVITGFDDDPDGDGRRNGLENFLGTDPGQGAAGGADLTEVAGTPLGMSFRHSRSHDLATDVAAGYEWSPDLVHWYAAGVTANGVTVAITSTVVLDRAAPLNDEIEVTATATAGTPAKLFVRLNVTQNPP